VRVLAIDLGTAAVRAGLFDEGGHVLGIERHPLSEPDGAGRGSAEQDPATWWSALVEICRTLAAAHGPDVDAICAVGHGPTCIAADEIGQAVRPAITWRDRRTIETAEELTAATGVTGWDLGIMPAALWIARHDPHAASAGRWHLGTWEWLAFRLCGVAATTSRPSDAVLAAAATIGLDTDALPPAVASGAIVGELTSDAAADLGFSPGAPVVAGTFDAGASVLGAGVTNAGQAVDVGGAAGGFAVMTDEPIAIGGYDPLPSLLPGRWLLGGAMAATGSALDWLVWNVLGGTIERDRLVAEAAEAPPGADGVVFLPYLAGERDPIHDPSATGAFVGLSLGHRRAHLARAVLEAAALAIRHVAAPIVESGLAVAEMRVSGGPARSDAWNRIKADVTGFPVVVPAVRETALMGAGILAQAAASAEPDLAARARAEVLIERRIEPDPGLRDLYQRVYERYVALYPAISASSASGNDR
jgi:xylulokinase